MLVTKYSITHQMLSSIGQIEAAKEVVMNAPLIPAWEAKLRKDALERMIYASTHLDGNHLTEDEVREILDGREVSAPAHSVQEIVNYRQLLKLIDGIWTMFKDHLDGLKFSEEMLYQMHGLAVAHILPDHVAGHYRQRQIIIRNTQTGEIAYSPPPAVEIEYLMEDLISWLNKASTQKLHPLIKAGIAHYELMRIQPFSEANGRVARVVTMLLLQADGYDLRKFYCLEDYYQADPMKYFLTIQKVSKQSAIDNQDRDLTDWLEYFLEGAAEEFTEIKDRVKRLSAESRVKDKLGDQVQLNERQMLIMEYLHRHKQMRNSDFRKIFPDFSDDTVLREIRFLKQKGLLKKIGGTKKAIYVLP